MTEPVRYQSADEDSARWDGFEFRDGDVVISTRSKNGTTWMQLICVVLVLRTPELPAPLATISPWLDWLVKPAWEVRELLARQDHRRVVKTHTPLDGVPYDPRATYVVVARHPLDMAVSLYHQSANLDRDRLRELIGGPPAAAVRSHRPELREWLLTWIHEEADPRKQLDSLPGVMRHLSDAWQRRTQSNVLLIRYEDLCADLGSQMRRIAAQLAVDVDAALWPELVEAATFERMRARAELTAPDPAGVFKDRSSFFRRGAPGAARELLTAAEIARYEERVAGLAPADMLGWLHAPAERVSRRQDA